MKFYMHYLLHGKATKVWRFDTEAERDHQLRACNMALSGGMWFAGLPAGESDVDMVWKPLDHGPGEEAI